MHLTRLDSLPLGRITGTLNGVSFQEVEIDYEQDTTTVVPNGTVWCIDEFAFDGMLQTP